MRCDQALDFGQRSGSIDHFDATRITLREIQVCRTYALEERVLFALEMVRASITDPGPADVERRVEQQRQLRLQAALDGLLQRCQEVWRSAPGAALISECRIREPIADDCLAGGKCGPDQTIEVVGLPLNREK